jgi:threonine/homoserine/homoserine lactone efflux protein
MVSFGLTAILAEGTFLYELIKYLGVGYLLYLAFQAINPKGKFVFEARKICQMILPESYLRWVYSPMS